MEGLKKMKQDGIKEEDFLRLKKAFFGRAVKSFDKITSVAHGFLANTFNNIGLFDYIDVIEDVTLDDINKHSRDGFSEELSVLSVIEPIAK